MLSLSSKVIPPLACNLFILTEPPIDEEMKKSLEAAGAKVELK